jgi:peptidoglycan/LPS O-acetylase OafA/YrhL
VEALLEPTPPLPSYLPALDGLRGIAIGLVLAMHFFAVPGGWAGVELFFVLSGFLITRILLNTKSRADFFRRFYARRVLRIMPIYYLTLAVVSLVAWPTMKGRIAWFLAYASNWVGLLPRMLVLPLSHTWSLATEEQFYLAWPLLIRISSVSASSFVCVAGICAMTATRCALALSRAEPLLFAYSPLSRGDGLLAGALLALAVEIGISPRRGNRQVAVAALVLSLGGILALVRAGLFSISGQSLWMASVGFPAVTAASTATVWLTLGLRPGSGVFGWLTGSPLRGLGRISYGLYLYHYVLLEMNVGAHLGLTELGRFAQNVAVLGLSIGMATLSWKLVEKPLLGLRD